MSNPSRVLITGGTGLVGRRLATALQRDGATVVVLSRDPARARSAVPGAEVFAWEPQSGPPPAEAFVGVDAVVNLAGEPVDGRWTAAKKARIRESRVAGTRNLVLGIQGLPADARPRVLVSASAIGYYGETGDEAKTESDPAAAEFLAEVCVAWEQAACGAEALGLRVVRLRIGIVLDSGGGALGKMIPLWKLGMGGPMGNGRQWVAWIHVDDLVSLVRFALVEELSGALNATAPGLVRQKDFAGALGRVLGRPAVMPAPAFALKLALGEFSVEVLGSRRVVPRRTEEVGFRWAYPELDAALAEVVG